MTTSMPVAPPQITKRQNHLGRFCRDWIDNHRINYEIWWKRHEYHIRVAGLIVLGAALIVICLVLPRFVSIMTDDGAVISDVNLSGTALPKFGSRDRSFDTTPGFYYMLEPSSIGTLDFSAILHTVGSSSAVAAAATSSGILGGGGGGGDPMLERSRQACRSLEFKQMRNDVIPCGDALYCRVRDIVRGMEMVVVSLSSSPLKKKKNNKKTQPHFSALVPRLLNLTSEYQRNGLWLDQCILTVRCHESGVYSMLNPVALINRLDDDTLDSWRAPLTADEQQGRAITIHEPHPLFPGIPSRPVRRWKTISVRYLDPASGAPMVVVYHSLQEALVIQMAIDFINGQLPLPQTTTVHH